MFILNKYDVYLKLNLNNLLKIFEYTKEQFFVNIYDQKSYDQPIFKLIKNKTHKFYDM